jgi:membrane associated rhomboid family serine protease
MIIPWNTDAPLYHFPFATIGLIVVNTAVFIATFGSEDPEPWMLAFGQGLEPQQWLTNVFMHADIGHLVGNMIFLWAFGLVIEGKLGWWKFLLVYLGLGAFESAVSQVYMLNGTGFALGASGAIYGLLAMALIWAPRNEMNCIGIFGFRPFHFDLPIVSFVALFVGWEVFAAWYANFEMSSAVLHLAGALPGFAVATIMLKLGLVDCENWDVFAVWQDREGQAPRVKIDPRNAAAKERVKQEQFDAAKPQFKNFLAGGQAGEALALHKKMSRESAAWQLNQQELLALVKALHQQQLWSLSVGPMVEYLGKAPDSAARMRLKLAQILIVHEHRPGRALGVLEKIPEAALEGDLRKARQQLERQAQTMYDRGDLEINDEDW